MTNVTRILLPNEGLGGRRLALGATIHLRETLLSFYFIHAATRISNEHRIEQLRVALDDLNTRHAKTERAVVLGDFNTLTGKDVDSTTRLFEGAGFSTPFSPSRTTWKTFIIELKLDWLWLRNLSASDYGIDRKVRLSDHWPLWVEVSLQAASAEKH
ncbi:MAG: hypothetical protein M3362_24400 [Acidobacteriota bacterium]|nr:hypothetical protein [Acidobacteriota bacterium]